MDLRNGRALVQSVDRREEGTLIPLIERHVEKGATTYSDGWRAYSSLNAHGSHHFTVEQQGCLCTAVKEPSHLGKVRKVHTNTIEGAYKIGRDHFQGINGMKITTIEGHLCGIVWRNSVVAAHSDVIISFFGLLYSHYTLHRERNLEIKIQVLSSLTAGMGGGEIE